MADEKKEVIVPTVPDEQAVSIPTDVIKMAITSGADLDKLEKLLTLQERWEANNARKTYNASMVLVHKNIPLISKTLTNDQTHSKYAALDAIICQTRDIYTEHGFSISFYEGVTDKPEHIRINADVIHSAGHKETYFYDVPMDGKGIKGNPNMTLIHAKASSTSYGRRYLMCMIWNIPTGDDDDGNKAGTPPKSTSTSTQKTTKSNSAVITEKQGKRLLAIANNAGYSHDLVKEYAKNVYGYEHLRDIAWKDYDAIVKHFEIQTQD